MIVRMCFLSSIWDKNSIEKQTLNDTLLVLERNIFFISGWVPYFVSLQEDSILLFTTRERWEQGLKPDKVNYGTQRL